MSKDLLKIIKLSIKRQCSRRKMENGKWKMENGKWKIENGKWEMGNQEQKKLTTDHTEKNSVLFCGLWLIFFNFIMF